ncbi:MAG: mannosyltransferase, partial [Solirubrobacteraceae bacterium]|nr:mannosyltransferase [Solirubrobacteraceae bacterium]
ALRRAPDAPRRDLALWAGFSALALLTHFFAGFLIAPEALWLLWRLRSRTAVVAVLGVAAVQAALLPLSLSDHSSRLDWINLFPLGVRIKQVPVDFALSTLYQSPAVTYGLLGAGLMTVAVLALLGFGGGPRRRRGGAVAAGVGAFALLVPIVLAVLGTDYLVARNLIAAWLPIALLLAAACTAPRTLPFGAVLAAVLLGAFVYAGLKINATPQYERPDWRGVARALGSAGSSRAIVAYDSSYATQPLSLYLPRIPWTQRISGPVSVGEVDVVANAYTSPSARLPAGVRRLSATTVGEFLVLRYAVTPGWRLTLAAIGQRASALVPGAVAPAVLLQPGPA